MMIPQLRPIMVGERTNVIGSRKFKRLIAEGKFEEAAEIARAQVKKGAHVIDMCLADPDRDEIVDMENFIKEVVKKVKVPLVIDSTDEAVIEKALSYSQGKAIINSINLKMVKSVSKQSLPSFINMVQPLLLERSMKMVWELPLKRN